MTSYFPSSFTFSSGAHLARRSLAVLALVFVLASTGSIALDPQAIGGAMTFVLVGIAVAFFAFLFAFGSTAVKGFAVTLVIGLIANIFTAVFVSKFIFDWELSGFFFCREVLLGVAGLGTTTGSSSGFTWYQVLKR